jgi:hypothetical protein
MRVELSAHAPPVLAPEKLWQLLATTVSGFRTAISDWTYRPEEHYMRGPGPKSLKKNYKKRDPLYACRSR